MKDMISIRVWPSERQLIDHIVPNDSVNAIFMVSRFSASEKSFSSIPFKYCFRLGLLSIHSKEFDSFAKRGSSDAPRTPPEVPDARGIQIRSPAFDYFFINMIFFLKSEHSPYCERRMVPQTMIC